MLLLWLLLLLLLLLYCVVVAAAAVVVDVVDVVVLVRGVFWMAADFYSGVFFQNIPEHSGYSGLLSRIFRTIFFHFLTKGT